MAGQKANKKGTQTSSFGAGKRESHDASGFYESRMHAGGLFAKQITDKELLQIETPPAGEWADRLYCHSAEDMHHIPDHSIALAVTSPPYNAAKDYDQDLTLEEYLGLIQNVGKEVYRVLRPGGRYAINIANLGRKPYIPLHAMFYQIHLALDFLPMGDIIWQKAKGAGGSTAWGSWMNAKSPRLRDLHEYILIFGKQSYSRPDSGASDIDREEFMAATLSVWEIPPESAKRVGHPAPYPVPLVERLIKLYTYQEDVVLDPFMGSGTSALAAINTGRHYVGYEIEPKYIQLAEGRIKQAQEAATDHSLRQ
ncbi:MAG: site-specific DNA-methyltransferase [Anaerolineae bacterium]|nr:site-specific DNA-methyltransferase [Anaerolineae bacterium]